MVNWVGTGEMYEQAVDHAQNVQMWNTLLDRTARWKFNTVRLAFTFPDTPRSSETAPPLEADLSHLTDILTILTTRGMKAILDFHNWPNTPGYFGSQPWHNNWIYLVQAIKSNPALDSAVVAYEPFNEPNPPNWASTILSTDDAWNALLQLTSDIRKIDSVKPIVWPSPAQGIGANPSTAVINAALTKNIVWSFHPEAYLPDGSTDAQADARLNNAPDGYIYQMLQAKKAGFDVWNGEFLCYNYAVYRYFCLNLINQCLANGFGFNYWLYSRDGKNSGIDDVLASSNYLKGSSGLGLLAVGGAVLVSLGLLAWASTR